MSDPVAAAPAAPPTPPGDPPPRPTDQGGPPGSFATLLGATAPPADPSLARSTDAGGGPAGGDSDGHPDIRTAHSGDGHRAAAGTAVIDPRNQSGVPPAPGPAAGPVGTAAPAAPPPPPHPGASAKPVGTAAPAPDHRVAPPAAAGAPQPLAAAIAAGRAQAAAAPAGATADRTAAPAPTAPPPARAAQPPARPATGPQSPAAGGGEAAAAPPAAAGAGGRDGGSGDRRDGDGHPAAAAGSSQPPSVRALVASAAGDIPAGQAPSAPAGPAGQPPDAGAQAAPVRAAATLANLADTTAATMRLAVGGGRAVAEITLHPAELGSVRVTMETHQDGGVTATVTAQTREAAQALSQAGRELRTALEAQGVTVHGLDVQVAADDSRGGRPDGQGDGRAATAGRTSTQLADEPETTIQPAEILLSSGSVNVLA